MGSSCRSGTGKWLQADEVIEWRASFSGRELVRNIAMRLGIPFAKLVGYDSTEGAASALSLTFIFT